MDINKNIIWEKWRPKTINDVILPERIKSLFEDGILDDNYIFYGNFGTGKTSLSQILIGMYTKDSAYLKIDASEETSIEVLRDKMNDFCLKIPMFETKTEYKYILLDEFDRASKSFQDAMKGFIEKYIKNVRFIITTNHPSKIDGGIKSRCQVLCFNPETPEEEKQLKRDFYKRLTEVILPEEKIEIEKSQLIDLINKNFPDMRSILKFFDRYKKSKVSNITSTNISDEKKNKLYDVVYDRDMSYEEIFHYVNSTFGADGIHELIDILSSSFIKWSIENNKNVDKLFKCNAIISDYGTKLNDSTDPLVLGLTIIGKFRDILL